MKVNLPTKILLILPVVLSLGLFLLPHLLRVEATPVCYYQYDPEECRNKLGEPIPAGGGGGGGVSVGSCKQGTHTTTKCEVQGGECKRVPTTKTVNCQLYPGNKCLADINGEKQVTGCTFNPLGECVDTGNYVNNYFTDCEYVGGGSTSGGCCKLNCSAANQEGGLGSCTLPSGAAAYKCDKKQCEDSGGGDPTLCRAPRICEDVIDKCRMETITRTKKNGKTETIRREVCTYKEVCHYPPSTCVNPTTCSPAACPAGTSETGTGALVTSRTCSYLQAGACDGNNNCRSATNVRRCYATFTPPPSSDDDPIIDHPSTTALGCFASGLTGREVNNDMDISIDFTDAQGASDIRAFLIWFGTDTTPPTVAQIATSGTPLLQSNNSFGFMVGNYNGAWRVFAPKYASGSAWSWVNLNSAGAGERGRIKGENGLDLGIIKDVVVSDVDSDTKRMTAKLEILHEDSGVTNFEAADSDSYTVFLAAQDTSRWVQGTGTAMSQTPSYQSAQTWTIDTNAPTREDISHDVVTADRLNLNWEFDDQAGILRVVGDAEVSSEGASNGPIDNLSSAQIGYELGSGDSGSETFAGHHLWVDDDESGTELIDIRNNEGGSIDFKLTAFDSACNAGEYTYNMELGEPWMITKGGVVFSANGTDMGVKSFTEHERFSDDSYWEGDFGFYKDESDLSTELLTGGGSSLNALINNVKLSSVRAQNYNDRNNKSEYWFDELSRKYNSMLAADPARYTDINIVDDVTTFDGSTSQIVDPAVSSKQCNGSTSCVVNIEGDLNIESGFSCNTRTTFIVDGDVNIAPDMTAANKRSGCMFISRGSITLDAGTHKSSSSSYPRYDIVEGFFITDGQILIPEVDQDEDVRDGLKVNGSLIAFGGAGGKSISMGRTLKLIDNNAYPTVAIHFDSRYLSFATTVFGGQTEAFKREVGFKPL